MWQFNGGSFDQSGYDIDHIKEFSISHDDEIKNLQALCRSCHLVKTMIFLQHKNKKHKQSNNNEAKLDTEDILEAELKDEDVFESDSEDISINSSDSDSSDISNNEMIIKSVFKCDKCDKIFNQKAHLSYHIKNNACKIYSYFCKYCNKGFSSDSSMYRHMKYNCKIKKQDIEKEKGIIERFLKIKEENEILKIKEKKLKKKLIY